MTLHEHILSAALTALLCCPFSMARAQHVTQRFKDEPLRDVIHEVERQTRMSFIFKADAIDESQHVTATFSRTPIKKVLRNILPEGVSFTIKKRLIILYRSASTDKTEKKEKKPSATNSNNAFIVTGRVVDNSGQPIMGATVYDQRVKSGTVTDYNGQFALNVEPNTTLQVSYIGYNHATINVGHRQQLPLIRLHEVTNSLNEVVVIGYGTTNRLTLTGAVDKIGHDEITRQKTGSLADAMQGLSPNLTVQKRSSDPNTLLTNINIRGISTLNSNAPLVVVDGMVSNEETLAKINPNDIDNISVLKDAGAAAIYGSRSGNGVILVTTKKGSRSERPAIKFSTAVGWQQPHILYEPLAGWQNAEKRNESSRNVGRYAEFSDAQIEDLRNHQDEERWFMNQIFRNALQQNHNVSVSGGTAHTSYMVSAGMFSQGSNYVGNSNYGTQRYNLRSNLQVEAGRLHLQALLAFVRENSVATMGSLLESDASRVPPFYYYKMKEDGKYLINDILSEFNPLGSLEAGGTSKSRNNDFTANATAEMSLVKGLSLKGSVGINITGNHTLTRQLTVPYYQSNNMTQPSRYDREAREVSDNNSDKYLINTQMLLNYDLAWRGNSLKAMLGLSNESATSSENNMRLYYSNSDLGTSTDNNAYITPGQGTKLSPETQMRTSISSAFGRVVFNHTNRYVGEFDFRYDGTSKFGSRHRWGFFPSISGSWAISEEPFMRSYKKSVGTLKLRSSLGVLGNQSISANERFTRYLPYNNIYSFNNKGVVGVGFTLGSDDLKWERTRTFNIGLDASFLNNSLTVSANLFHKDTRHILMRPMSATVYGTDLAITNVGRMANSGWELTLKWNGRTGQVTHELSLNLADTRNWLRSFPEGEEVAQLEEMWVIKKVGVPLNSYYGYRVAGIFQSEEEIAEAALPLGITVYPGDLRFVDRDGNGIIDGRDRFVLGNAFPRYAFGLTYTMTWKGLDMSLFINGVGKRDMMVHGELVEPFFGNYSYTMYRHQTDYWTATNTNSHYPRLAAPGSTSEINNYRMGSDIYIFNAAYARLKNITVGYTLPPKITRWLHLQRLRFYATGQNLFTLSPTTFIDPETSEFDSSMTFRSANTGCKYPPLRYWGVGFDIDF